MRPSFGQSLTLRADANPQDCVADGSIRRIGGPTSANFSPVRSTITQLSGSTHFPNTRGVVSGLTGVSFSFVVGFDIGKLLIWDIARHMNPLAKYQISQPTTKHDAMLTHKLFIV